MATPNTKKKFSFQEAIAKIKATLKMADEPAAGDNDAADALKDYTTDAGVKLKIDKLETGGKVFLEDGTTIVTKGVTLSDGTILEIGEDGIITSVTVKTADDQPETDEQKMAAIAAKFASGTPEDRIATLEAMCLALMQYNFGWKIDEATRKAIEEQAIAAYKTLNLPAQFAAQVETLKTAAAAENQKLKVAMGEVLNLFQKFAEQPADDAAQKPANASGSAPSKKEKGQQLLMAAQRKINQDA